LTDHDRQPARYDLEHRAVLHSGPRDRHDGHPEVLVPEVHGENRAAEEKDRELNRGHRSTWYQTPWQVLLLGGLCRLRGQHQPVQEERSEFGPSGLSRLAVHRDGVLANRALAPIREMGDLLVAVSLE